MLCEASRDDSSIQRALPGDFNGSRIELIPARIAVQQQRVQCVEASLASAQSRRRAACKTAERRPPRGAVAPAQTLRCGLATGANSCCFVVVRASAIAAFGRCRTQSSYPPGHSCTRPRCVGGRSALCRRGSAAWSGRITGLPSTSGANASYRLANRSGFLEPRMREELQQRWQEHEDS